MVLRAEYAALALQLQEADMSLSSDDVRSRLWDAIRDKYRGSGTWAYLVTYYGDGESGDVIYSCDGDTCRAPYEMVTTGGAAKCSIDFDKAEDVVPRTIYEPEMDEGDHLAQMSESLVKSEKLYTELPLYERFISKAERDKASADDFAGKGKSFPILKREDVMAAVRSIGRAGSGNLGPSAIKKRIIAIAKRKGWEDELPKAWREHTDSSESNVSRETTHNSSTDTLRLVESMVWGQGAAVALLESAGTVEKEIKIIAPGEGSTAVYTPEALKSSGPSIFKAGTQMFINHATRQEEAERPEGDWNKLVGALSTDSYYLESHKDGPGLYAKAKFAEGIAPDILAKAKLGAGLSIRASGMAVMEAGKPKTQNGKPVLAKFTGCESIDIVTKAGAGGMIPLQESAVKAKEGEVSGMDAAEIKQLQESLAAQTAINKRLMERALRSDAKDLATAVLSTTSLTESQRVFVAESVIGTAENPRAIPTKEDGNLDAAKLTEAVNAQAKAYSATLPATGGVRGMGAGPTLVTETPEQQAVREARAKDAEQRGIESLMALGLSEAAAKEQVKGVAA